jgi:hypothetical protein
MDPAVLSAIAALGGSTIGAFASLATSRLAQLHQRRMQHEMQESSRRERVFSEFILKASGLYADALTSNHLDPAKLVSLYAVKAQLGLFASRSTIDQADEVLRLIIAIYYEPNLDSDSQEAVTNGTHDFLKSFTQAAQKDLLL